MIEAPLSVYFYRLLRRNRLYIIDVDAFQNLTRLKVLYVCMLYTFFLYPTLFLCPTFDTNLILKKRSKSTNNHFRELDDNGLTTIPKAVTQINSIQDL